MGRIAGYNVVSELLGEPMLPLRIPWYVTVLDLGPAGAVYTEGWDRQVAADGAEAKATKRTINTQRIYPPPNGNRDEILAAASPPLSPVRVSVTRTTPNNGYAIPRRRTGEQGEDVCTRRLR